MNIITAIIIIIIAQKAKGEFLFVRDLCLCSSKEANGSKVFQWRQKVNFYLSETCVCVVVRKLMVQKSFSDSSHLTGIYVDEQDTANDEWVSVNQWYCAHQGWRPNLRESCQAHEGRALQSKAYILCHPLLPCLWQFSYSIPLVPETA